MEIIESVETQEYSLSDRVFVMGYAVFAYLVGAGALFWLIFAAGGFVPLGFVDLTGGKIILAIAVNAGLVILFGVQHSIMARSKFKERMARVMPRHLERATFVLASGVVSIFLIVFWQEIDVTVWQMENAFAAVMMQVVYLFGIVYLLASSCVTNHFELFGLRQAWLYFTNKPYTPLEFKQRWMYRYSRHPMMLGLLIIFWCSPEMTVTRFIFALLFTIYIFEGIRHEEGGLIEEFGDDYRDYQKKIGMFFTVK